MDHAARATQQAPISVNRLAARATTHCLIGCGIGEMLGVVMGTALGWSTAATTALAIGLAFVFGYSLTIWPLVASGMALRAALGLALVADTVAWVVTFPVLPIAHRARPRARRGPRRALRLNRCGRGR